MDYRFVKENLEQTKQQIAQAVMRAEEHNKEVTLIAVSKTKPSDIILEAYQYGQRDFGENRVQELLKKQQELPKDIRWHLIGHLQTNKVRQVIGKTTLIHSVDSLRLIEALQAESEHCGIVTDILLEVNAAREASKFGFFTEELSDIVQLLSKTKNLRVCGLMTVAPFTENSEDNRKYFRQIRQIAVDISAKNIDNISMDTLSMGMTGDFEVAIDEGATRVRVGTDIFGERDYRLEQ